MNEAPPTALRAARDRLARQGLLAAPRAGVSLRLPGGAGLLFLDAAADTVEHLPVVPHGHAAALHAAVYALRSDAGALAYGGGPYANALADFGGALPQVFDEQARHLGRMGPPATSAEAASLRPALAHGGNALLLGGVPVCLGMTCQRLVFNAELFEKCAEAWVLAAATGQAVSTLPAWVRAIANGRLRRDQRRATLRYAQGLLPEDVRGY